ncbi:MAG TPA: hypothetical protein VGY77_12275 [Gemmataceae bacterium]|nr:hypothetical protein [Gemmataceae bacterium]
MTIRSELVCRSLLFGSLCIPEDFVKVIPPLRRRLNVLGSPWRHRPHLEILEDRLPPGAWFLRLGLEEGPTGPLSADWSILDNSDVPQPPLTASLFRERRGESLNAAPHSAARIAFVDHGVRDLFEGRASTLPGMSDAFGTDIATGQRPVNSADRGTTDRNISLGSLRAGAGEVGSLAPGAPGPVHKNGWGMVPPIASHSAWLNPAGLPAPTLPKMAPTPGAHGGYGVPTFTFVDRPDVRDGENYGLMPDTFGYASGLLVTFDVSLGQLDNPRVVGAPSSCGDPATELAGPNTILVDFGKACALPAAPATPGGLDNQVAVQVDADPAAEVTPAAITWLATINNVVPRRLSSETNVDSEPSLAVSPAAGTVALTTFSGSWSSSRGAPLWVSGDRGTTWDQRFGIPEPEPGAFGPADQTMAYNADGSVLYGTFLGGSRFFRAYVRSTPDPLTTDFAGSYASFGGADQPWIQVGPVDPATGLDRVYVSVNDTARQPASANVLVSIDGAATFQDPVRLERGTAVFSDHPPRVAVSGGRVYGAFLRRTSPPSDVEGPGEVVVVRDDQGGIRGPANPDPFAVLDQGIVVQSGSYPTAGFLLGQQRIGGDLSLAIDPQDPDTLYLSFSRIENHQPVLYVHRSQDGGNTWKDLLTIDNAAIGNLAVAANGTWGLMNVRVDNGRMIQEFRQNGGDPTVLTSWPANDPRGGIVYVGDYQSLVAVGNTFYAGFCASNFPDLADFPSGVVYQRNSDFPGHRLLSVNGNPVQHSIDPFFFRQTASDPGG